MAAPLQLHYINGFNSGVEYQGEISSQKARFFRDAAEASGWTLVPHNADYYTIGEMELALTRLTSALERSPGPALAMGTSLGGLVALLAMAAVDKPDVKAVLINPVLIPDEGLLADMLDTRVTNWVTGREHWVDPAIKDRLRDWLARVPGILDRWGDQVQVHLDWADEVLDSPAGAELCRPHCEVHVYPDGDHRFAHYVEAWPEVKRFAERML